MKKILITFLIIFLSATSGLNFAATDNETGMMQENNEEENSDLTKHALGKGKTVGILMFVLLVLIVMLKYTRGY